MTEALAGWLLAWLLLFLLDTGTLAETPASIQRIWLEIEEYFTASSPCAS